MGDPHHEASRLLKRFYHPRIDLRVPVQTESLSNMIQEIINDYNDLNQIYSFKSRSLSYWLEDLQEITYLEEIFVNIDLEGPSIPLTDYWKNKWNIP